MSDDQTNQKHPIERLLGKPLLPSTEQRPYKITEEVWVGLDDLEAIAKNRNASPKTSENKKPFDARELDYLTRIEAAMQNPVQASTVRMWLEKAQADGLDARRIYEAAVNARPPQWEPAPSFAQMMISSAG
ncbi:MAG: hypothetical protein GDA65_02710 [Nitrospira sp. CR1.1]|jgi:hypothetical protein|nr:hypothetical protein [Nitrospira sp. CR1.1]